MEERVKVLPVLEHVTRVQMKFLVMQITSPHVRWRQVKIQVTFSQVSSPLTHSAPGSDVNTGDRGVLGLVTAKWIFAFRILNGAVVFCSGFDEESARSAVFHHFGEQRRKGLEKPWPVPLHRLVVDRLVLRKSCFNVCQVLS